MSAQARTSGSSVSHRSAWAAGIVFVVALVAEVVVAAGVPANQDDSPAAIASALAQHERRLVAIACISVVYAASFTVYPNQLSQLLRDREGDRSTLASLVLVGGVLFVALHAVSDIGVTGLVLDLAAFVLFLVFVLASSIVLFRQGGVPAAARPGA